MENLIINYLDMMVKEINLIGRGWSKDKKYYIENEKLQKFVLRVSDLDRLDSRKLQCEHLKRMDSRNVPKVLDFGILNDKYMFILLDYVEGVDLIDVIDKLSDSEAYELGREAGSILKDIHNIEIDDYDNGEFVELFNFKLNRIIDYYNNHEELEIDYFDKIVDIINKKRSLLNDRPICFRHGDYHIGNMLLTNGHIKVIDFDRADIGDPWEEYDRFVFTWSKSPAFANGQIHGYFDDKIPDNFFDMVLLYTLKNLLASLIWAKDFDENEIKVARENIDLVISSYDSFNLDIPSWYIEPNKIDYLI